MDRRLLILAFVVIFAAFFSLPNASAECVRTLERPSSASVSSEGPKASMDRLGNYFVEDFCLIKKDQNVSDNVLDGILKICEPYPASANEFTFFECSIEDELKGVYIHEVIPTDYIFGVKFYFKQFQWRGLFRTILSLGRNSSNNKAWDTKFVLF